MSSGTKFGHWPCFNQLHTASDPDGELPGVCPKRGPKLLPLAGHKGLTEFVVLPRLFAAGTQWVPGEVRHLEDSVRVHVVRLVELEVQV